MSTKETAVRFSEADRFGVRGKVLGVGKGDSRTTVRVNVEILRGSTVEVNEAQRLHDEMATSYYIVKAADTFPIWGGKKTPQLTEADLPALAGKTFVLDPAKLAPVYYAEKERKASTREAFSGTTEAVFNRAAELIVAAKTKAKLATPEKFKDGAAITGKEIHARYNAKGADGKLSAAAKDFRKLSIVDTALKQATAETAPKTTKEDADI